MFKVYNTKTGKYVGDDFWIVGGEHPRGKDVVVFFKSNGKIDRFETSMHRGDTFSHQEAYELCSAVPDYAYHPAIL